MFEAKDCYECGYRVFREDNIRSRGVQAAAAKLIVLRTVRVRK